MTGVEVTTIKVNDVIGGGPDKVPCTVLKIEEGVETVQPLAGRSCWKLWVKRQDTGEEGEITIGPRGMVWLIGPGT